MDQASSHQRVLDLVDLCYQSVEEPSLWQTIVEQTSDLLGADAADITIEHHATGLIDVCGSIGFDPAFRECYDEAYFGKNPWIRQSSNLPICKAFSSEFEPEDFEKTAFYGEWLKPQGLRLGLGSTLECTRDRVVHIGFIRKRRRAQFNKTEVSSLDRLLPHFRRSLRLSDRLRTAGLERANLATLLDRFVAPMFLTDDHRRIVLLNRAAERLLEHGEVMRVSRKNGLVLVDRKAEAEFRHRFSLLANDGHGHSGCDGFRFAIPRHTANALIVSLTPVRMLAGRGNVAGRCLIVVDDPSRDLTGDNALLRDAYGLTDAEANLASALAAGDTLAEYAARHAIGISTVRWHLKNMQAKTGKRRLESLTALVSSALSRTVE